MAKSPSTKIDPSQNTMRIFYAWQSDLPNDTNKNAIRRVLRTLRTPLETEFSSLALDIEIDEATRNEPGSPNIPATILAKIAKSHIFVGDVSLVNHGVTSDPKKTPNPNVLFELGYAVAHLGWSRIILVFNRAFGNPEDLPFDIDRQRVSSYVLKKASDDASQLQEMCKSALGTIIAQNPPRPNDIFDAESTKRSRDLRALELLFRAVHWPIIEQHLRSAPNLMSDNVLSFWESFHGIRHSTAFHLYDKKLLKLIDVFGRHWHETMRFGERYNPVRSGVYAFTFSNNAAQMAREQRDWNHIEKHLSGLRKAMRSLLSYLRRSYLELDFEKLSETAWSDHQRAIIEIEKLFADKPGRK